MSTSLAFVNTIVPQISLPTKGTWSNNTMPFTGNYYPTSLTGRGLVSKTALDYWPPSSFRRNTPHLKFQTIKDSILFYNLRPYGI